VDKQDVNQGRVRIGQLGYQLGHPDEFPLMVGNDILGGGGFTARMMKRIRSDEGLAYGAYSNITFPATMPGTFSAYFQTKSSTVAYATQLTFDLIGQLRSAPPTAEEMETSTASFIETFPRRFESPARTVGLYATDELLGRPHDYWTTYRDKVRAVTAADVEEAMSADLHPDRMVVLVVGRIDDILEGHPDHEAKLADFGELHRLPLRDPMTLQPIADTAR
jgi:zinc protease